MAEVAHSQAAQTPFKGVTARTIEDMEAEAGRLLEQAREKRIADDQQRQAAYEQKKAEGLTELQNCKHKLQTLDSAAKLAGQLSLSDAEKYSIQRTELLSKIEKIESAYQLRPTGYEEVLQEKAERKSQAANIRAAVIKIGSWALLGYAFVFLSGNWILNKYPGAAIYNEVSFQKVLFAIAVGITIIGAVILALNAVFPGIGRYLNPFNLYEFDFFDDFTTLTPWQRNIIALALFSVVLFSFVWIVSGKLD